MSTVMRCNSSFCWWIERTICSESKDAAAALVRETDGNALYHPTRTSSCSPRTTSQNFFNPATSSAKTVELRPLERQVAHFLMQGKTYEEIAAAMSLTIAGVKYHQKKIFQKLHISSRHEISKVYLREQPGES